MKRVTLFLMLLTIQMNISSQDIERVEKNVAKLNMFGFFKKDMDLKYERRINDHISCQLGLSFKLNIIGEVGSRISWTGGSFTPEPEWGEILPEIRYYRNRALEGLYFSLFTRGKWSNKKRSDEIHGETYELYSSTSSIGGGLALGYQLKKGDHLVLDFFAGPQFRKWMQRYDEFLNGERINSFFEPESLVNIKVGFNLGYSF